MFLSAELRDDGSWVVLYEPEGSDFEGVLDPKHPTSERAQPAALTQGLWDGKLRSDRRGPDVESSNNDRVRAGKLIEPGVYEVIITPEEIEEYRSAVSWLVASPSYAHVMDHTSDMGLATDIAHLKMVWLARFLDKEHRVDRSPPGVRLVESTFQALQRVRDGLAEDREHVFDGLMVRAMGPDWRARLAAAQGHPIQPTRVLPYT